MFVDTEEVESNLQACAQLSCQILDNVLDEEETEEVYGQDEAYPRLKLFQHACTSFSDLKSFSDDLFYDEYHEEGFVEGGDISALEKVVAPHHLTVDLENQLTFLAHDNLLHYILLKFGQ
jgi:hypothetical protein